MSIDREVLEEYKQTLADRYMAPELVELLNLDVWEILEEFEEKVIELHAR